MDISLYYQEKGRGLPLLLLHGNGEDCSYFEGQVERFSGRYRVIAVDTRGHGRSPRGEAPFTIEQFARDLRGLMDSLGLERAAVLGFSDGANIAMRFALMYPERVRALILGGGNLDPSGIKRRVQIPIELGYRLTKLFAARSEEARRHMELLGLMVNEPHISPRELGAVKAPTLVIAGTRDMVKRSHTELIAGSIPGARLAIIKGDHFVAGKRPESFNREVERFLWETDTAGVC